MNESKPPCKRCHGRGVEMLTECPLKLITTDIRAAIDAEEDLSNNAGWPHGGGWLHEPAILVEAVRYVRTCNARAKEKARKSLQF